MYFIDINFCILLQITVEYIPDGPTDNESALVQQMALHI